MQRQKSFPRRRESRQAVGAPGFPISSAMLRQSGLRPRVGSGMTFKRRHCLSDECTANSRNWYKSVRGPGNRLRVGTAGCDVRSAVSPSGAGSPIHPPERMASFAQARDAPPGRGRVGLFHDRRHPFDEVRVRVRYVVGLAHVGLQIVQLHGARHHRLANGFPFA